MTVRVRIVTPITTQGFRRPEEVKALGGADITVDCVEVDAGPASIECAFEVALAAPGTIAKVIDAEKHGIDAVVIDCMADPGLVGAREAVAIPVLGAGQTAMHVAAMLGHRFSVVTVLKRLRSQFEQAAATFGLGGKLASVRAIGIPVLDLERDLPATERALVAEAERAVLDDGADTIVFGCTGIMGCAAAVREGLLRRGVDIPVVDPIPTAVSMAAAIARARLSQSKTAYPAPPDKSVVGYTQIGIGIELPTAAE
jgi:allantoin racemase